MDFEHWSGNSKDSRAHLEAIDGSASSKHSKADSGVTNGSGSSKHSESQPDIINRKGSSNDFKILPGITYDLGSSNPFEVHPLVINGTGSSKHSKSHSDAIDRSSISKHLRLHSDPTIGEGDTVFPAKTLRSTSYSSSASSSSEEENLFQVNTIVLKSITFTTPTTSNKKTQPGLKYVHHVSHGNSSNSGESTSPISVVTHESVGPSVSPTHSPSIQVMNRSEGYDPYRIPSAVFERSESTTPIEWSVASNESLFSIHIGNSFSRDHTFPYCELTKSGELTKSSELIAFSPIPPVAVVETKIIGAEMENNEAIEVPDKPAKDATEVTLENESEEKPPPLVVSWDSSTISKLSDEILTSRHSFSFPIKKKCAWRSCYCSNCSWAFCYCWNCSRKRWCCHSSPILEKGVTSGPVKGDVQEQNPQPASKVTSNSASNGCFHCLPSCSRCFSFNCCSFRCFSFRCCSSSSCSFRRCFCCCC